MSISPEQLSNLLDRHWGPLLAWVGPCGGAAEDVVQQAFIALSGEFPSPRNPAAWLYATSRNLAINEKIQQERRLRRNEIAARSETQPAEIWKTNEAADLVEKLGRLSDQAREIVVAHIWGDLSFDEIASVLNLSRATIWRQYQLALTQLRNLYGVTCETKN